MSTPDPVGAVTDNGGAVVLTLVGEFDLGTASAADTRGHLPGLTSHFRVHADLDTALVP
ncbi:hypothetical protein ACPZ19_50025 [Amycolatopsis lurida]